MLIQTGEIKNILTEATASAGNHVGDYLFIGMAKVRLAVDVIDGCRDVELLAQGHQVVAEHGLTGKTPLFYRNLSVDLADNVDAFLELSARNLLGDDSATEDRGAG